MGRFAVISAVLNYDYIEHVACRGVLATQEAAEARIREIGEEQRECNAKRRDYIHKFVDSLEAPDPSSPDWKSFLAQFQPFKCRRKDATGFRDKLKSYLFYNPLQYAGYAPPELPQEYHEYFAVDLQEEPYNLRG